MHCLVHSSLSMHGFYLMQVDFGCDLIPRVLSPKCFRSFASQLLPAPSSYRPRHSSLARTPHFASVQHSLWYSVKSATCQLVRPHHPIILLHSRRVPVDKSSPSQLIPRDFPS